MLMTKTLGKPYAGKPHVRFDEGVGKASAFSLYSTEITISQSFSKDHRVSQRKNQKEQ